MTPEQKVQNNIEDHLKTYQKMGFPIFYQKRQAGGYNYKKGIPDIYIVIGGKHIEVEVKKPGGEPSSMQLMWYRRFREEYGIRTYIVDSWDSLYEEIKIDIINSELPPQYKKEDS